MKQIILHDIVIRNIHVSTRCDLINCRWVKRSNFRFLLTLIPNTQTYTYLRTYIIYRMRVYIIYNITRCIIIVNSFYSPWANGNNSRVDDSYRKNANNSIVTYYTHLIYNYKEVQITKLNPQANVTRVTKTATVIIEFRIQGNAWELSTLIVCIQIFVLQFLILGKKCTGNLFKCSRAS